MLCPHLSSTTITHNLTEVPHVGLLLVFILLLITEIAHALVKYHSQMEGKTIIKGATIPPNNLNKFRLFLG